MSYLARTPCVPSLCTLFTKGGKREGLLDYQGRAGIISIVRWNLRPVIFGVENGIADREKYFRINYAFHSRYRYRRKFFRNLCFVAEADTAVRCSFEGGP